MTTNISHEVLTGICSVCLGRFVVEGKSPVLHGYKRPGDGYIVGNCDGMRFPMYEISTEGCIWMRNGLTSAAVQKENYAGQLRAGQVSTIPYVRNKYDARLNRYVPEIVDLTPDSKEALREVGFFTWESAVKSAAERADREARSFRTEAEDFQKMIDAWKPGLEFISEDRLNADKLEAHEEKARLADRKRRFKALKTAFFHIGAAIAKHKKGWDHAEWDWEQIGNRHHGEGYSQHYATINRLPAFEVRYPQYAKKTKKK